MGIDFYNWLDVTFSAYDAANVYDNMHEIEHTITIKPKVSSVITIDATLYYYDETSGYYITHSTGIKSFSPGEPVSYTYRKRWSCSNHSNSTYNANVKFYIKGKISNGSEWYDINTNTSIPLGDKADNTIQVYSLVDTVSTTLVSHEEYVQIGPPGTIEITSDPNIDINNNIKFSYELIDSTYFSHGTVGYEIYNSQGYLIYGNYSELLNPVGTETISIGSKAFYLEPLVLKINFTSYGTDSTSYTLDKSYKLYGTSAALAYHDETAINDENNTFMFNIENPDNINISTVYVKYSNSSSDSMEYYAERSVELNTYDSELDLEFEIIDPQTDDNVVYVEIGITSNDDYGQTYTNVSRFETQYTELNPEPIYPEIDVISRDDGVVIQPLDNSKQMKRVEYESISNGLNIIKKNLNHKCIHHDTDNPKFYYKNDLGEFISIKIISNYNENNNQLLVISDPLSENKINLGVIINLKTGQIREASFSGTLDSTQDIILGDYNNDGSIDNKDYALLMQYLNGWNVDIVKHDINNDDVLDYKDSRLLMQYLNGWNVELGTNYDNFEYDVDINNLYISYNYCPDGILYVNTTPNEESATWKPAIGLISKNSDGSRDVFLPNLNKWLIKNNEFTAGIFNGGNLYIDNKLINSLDLSDSTIFDNNSYLQETISSNFAFCRCKSLTQVNTINDSINIIGEHMFAECVNLKNVIIGNNITRINSNAFYRCENLMNVYITDSVTHIEDDAFSNTSSDLTFKCSEGSYADNYAKSHNIKVEYS